MSTINNVAWNIASLIVEKLLALAITIIIINFFSNNYLGYFSLLLAVVAMLSSLMSAGMASFILYKIDCTNLIYIKKINVLVSISMTIVFTVFYFFSARVYVDSPLVDFDRYEYVLLVFSLSITQVFISNYTNYFRVLNLYSLMAKISFFKNILIILILIYLAINHSFEMFLYGITVGSAFSVLLYIVVFNKVVNYPLVVGNSISMREIIVELFMYSKFFIVASFISSFLIWFVRDYIAVTHSMLELSVYTIAFQLSLVFTFITGSIGTVYIKKLKVTCYNSDFLSDYFRVSLKAIAIIFISFLSMRQIVFTAFSIDESSFSVLVNFMLYFSFFSYVWLLGPTLTAKAKGGVYCLLTLIKLLCIIFVLNVFLFDLVVLVIVLISVELIVFFVYIYLLKLPPKFFYNAIGHLGLIVFLSQLSAEYNVKYIDFSMLAILLIYLYFNKSDFLNAIKK